MANQALIELATKIVSKKAEREDKYEFAQVIDALRQKGATNPMVLWEINEIITRTADEILRPRVDFLDYVAETQRVEHGQKIEFLLPAKKKISMNWTGRGNTVDYARVGTKNKITAEPDVISGGIYYEIDQLLSGSIDPFIGAVDDLVIGMGDKITGRVITTLGGVSAAAPAANVWTGTNITPADFSKVASTVQRYDRNASVVCDIDFAKKLMGFVDAGYLSESMKEERNANGLFGVVDGVNIITFANTFEDDKNTTLVAPRKYAFIVPSSSNGKVVKVGYEGGLEQYTSMDVESERVFLKVTQKASVNIASNLSNIGFLEDASLA